MQAIGPVGTRRALIEKIEQPSIREQCDLLDISRASYYYTFAASNSGGVAVVSPSVAFVAGDVSVSATDSTAVEKGPSQPSRHRPPDARLAGAHKAGEDDVQRPHLRPSSSMAR